MKTTKPLASASKTSLNFKSQSKNKSAISSFTPSKFPEPKLKEPEKPAEPVF